MSTAPGTARARGRELSLLALCHLESYPQDERPAALELLWAHPPGIAGEPPRSLVDDTQVRAAAQALLSIVLARSAEIDAEIEATSVRWRLDRMDRIERNVLRLATAELLAELETPRGVVIAEAVRLAERYGGERSAPFVNGVAESLARRLRDRGDAEGG